MAASDPVDDRTAFVRWLADGIEAGWVSEPWCIEHGDDRPLTHAERADPDLAFDDSDEHVYAVVVLVDSDPPTL